MKAFATHMKHRGDYATLLRMDDAMLKDIGVSRDEVKRLRGVSIF